MVKPITIIHDYPINQIYKLFKVLLIIDNCAYIELNPTNIIIKYSNYIIIFRLIENSIYYLRNKEIIGMIGAKVYNYKYLHKNKYKYDRICRILTNLWRECFHRIHRYKITLDKLNNNIIFNIQNYIIICNKSHHVFNTLIQTPGQTSSMSKILINNIDDKYIDSIDSIDSIDRYITISELIDEIIKS
jgi:hypothetical protein